MQDSVHVEFLAAHTAFHTLLDELSDSDLRQQSLNPGWTTGELLAHMVFGFVIINALFPLARAWGRLPRSSSRWFAWLLNSVSRPFNWINAWGARLQGSLLTRRRLGIWFDHFHGALMRQLDALPDEEWEKGMYYPRGWDSDFDEFMTVEKLAHYPITHFNFHLGQIAGRKAGGSAYNPGMAKG
jgi:hypothetical protein